jgi:hypothetical protein
VPRLFFDAIVHVQHVGPKILKRDPVQGPNLFDRDSGHILLLSLLNFLPVAREFRLQRKMSQTTDCCLSF